MAGGLDFKGTFTHSCNLARIIKMLELEERIQLERRLSKSEEKISSIHGDIRDIKKTIKWLSGLVFSLNTTIIGILTKGFGML